MSNSVKPFLAGAATALSVVFLVQKLRNRKTPQPALDTRRSSPTKVMDSPHLEERIIRKAEAAIRNRTSRLIIVVERCTNDHNYSAILRTAEALGIQHVWIIAPPKSNEQDETSLTTSLGKVVKRVSAKELQSRAMHHLFARKATEWLNVREFEDTASCISELKLKRYTVWATDLSQQAVCLEKNEIPPTPEKVAIVFGTEAVGCTQEMLEAADLRVYLPLRGFADSLNLSVATALVIQQLFVLDPSLLGSMPEEERRELREKWFAKLAMQRFLTSTEKRNQHRLQAKLQYCQELQLRLDQGKTIQKGQQEKLDNMSSIETELQELDDRLQQMAQVAVKDLVDNPPEPLTDMRRADEHRTCYVGRKTKKRNGPAWENMPATTGYNTANGVSSAEYFRSRAAGSNVETEC